MEENNIEVADLTLPSSDAVGDHGSSENPMNEHEKDSLLYWQLGQKLGTCMLHLYTNNLWTDVTFQCKDHVEDDKADRIHAHKIVLAARSPFFQAMFYGPCAEFRGSDVDLLTTEAVIFDLVMRYIYSDETRLTEDTAPRVLELAHMYQIPNLVEYCADFLASVLRSDNACEILELALVYNQNKLRDDACVFIDNHAKQVLDSDGFLRISNACLTHILKGDTLFENEGYIFKRAMVWAECKLPYSVEAVDGQKKRDVLGEAFFYLRVPTLGNLEFIKCIKGEGFYTVQEIESIIEYINDKSCLATLCHSVATRAPRNLEVRIPTVEQITAKPTDPKFYESRTLEKTFTKKIDCTILVKVLKDCYIQGVLLQNNFPCLPFLVEERWRDRSVRYQKDNLVDVTLNCALYIDEIQFRTEFEMKYGEHGPIMLGKHVPLRRKETPYSIKFEIKYRGEHSLIYLETLYDSRARGDKCEDDSHTETCMYMLRESPSVGGCSASYCNSSKHFNCIESLEVDYLPCRINDISEYEEIPVEERN